MYHFTPISALLGGLMIGAAAVLYLLFVGRYTGISGIARGAAFGDDDRRLDVLFIVGLITAGVVAAAFSHGAAPVLPTIAAAAIGGIFVGVGTSIGRGCTSGHGVCGLGRLSLRSLVAVASFLSAGMATVFLLHHVLVRG